MYNFHNREPTRRYGRVKRGWHPARIHEIGLNNAWSDLARQYIKANFEMTEKQFEHILVPGFFNCNEKGTPDPRFIQMGKAAGLSEDYGDDLNAVLRDLIGRELMVYVVHRYKGGRRRERAEDFKPLSGA
jgi:hypothetical protein